MLFIFHVSYPYRKTGITSLFYSPSFVLLEMLLELHVFFSLMNAPGPLYYLPPYKLWLQST